MKKRVIVIGTAVLLMLLSGCGGKNDVKVMPDSQSTNVNVEKQDETENVDTTKEEINNEAPNVTQEDVNNYNSSTSENDTDLGLRNLKIDTAAGILTEDQMLVMKYFVKDYLTITSVESLSRYPNIFNKAQIEVWGHVIKILKSDSNEYEVLCSIMESREDADYSVDLNNYRDNSLIVVRGKQGDSRFIVGDVINVEGRFDDTQDFQIDGTSYILPVVNAHVALLKDEDVFYPSRMSMLEVKKVAKTIFGDNLTLSQPVTDEFYQSNPYYLCTLDNQSIPKISNYRFYHHDGTMDVVTDDLIYRKVEFSPDFQHFFLFSIDYQTETLLLEYYDQNLNKIWKREFEGTTQAIYDFTKNNVYLNSDNYLYIINIETGEDTYTPSYVGKKSDIRKIEDGILLFGEDKKDAIIKTDIEGKIIWTADTLNNNENVKSVQILSDRIVVHTDSWEAQQIQYIVLDPESGSIIQIETIDSGFWRPL